MKAHIVLTAGLMSGSSPNSSSAGTTNTSEPAGVDPSVKYEIKADEIEAIQQFESSQEIQDLLTPEKLTATAVSMTKLMAYQEQTPAEMDAEIQAWQNDQLDTLQLASKPTYEEVLKKNREQMTSYFGEVEKLIPTMTEEQLNTFRLNITLSIHMYSLVKDSLKQQADFPQELIDENLQHLISLRKAVIDQSL